MGVRAYMGPTHVNYIYRLYWKLVSMSYSVSYVTTMLWALPTPYKIHAVRSYWHFFFHSFSDCKSRRMSFQVSNSQLQCKSYNMPMWRYSFSRSDHIEPPNHVHHWTHTWWFELSMRPKWKVCHGLWALPTPKTTWTIRSNKTTASSNFQHLQWISHHHHLNLHPKNTRKHILSYKRPNCRVIVLFHRWPHQPFQQCSSLHPP